MIPVMQSSGWTTVGRLLQVASALAVVLLLLASELPARVECQEQMLSIESRQQKDSDDLTDTIKYLEKLDKYFSQIARPRFGRSDYKQPHRLQPTSGWLRPSDSSSSLLFGGQNSITGQYGNLAADPLDLARARIY